MQLKVLDVKEDNDLVSVLLFTEDKPEDYVFSHLLSLVEDKDVDVPIHLDSKVNR